MIDPKVFKAVRKRLGLSQQELADQLGLSRVTINKMERGRLKNGIPDEIGARLLAIKRPTVTGNLSRAREAFIERETCSGDSNGPLNVNDDHLWDNEEDES